MVRYHPIPDLPNHLAAVSVWHHYADPRFDVQRYYALSLGAAPYWGYYLLTHLLAYPLGLDAANRVVLSLYVVGLPVGFSLLAKRFGKSPWLGLFAVPLVWNFNFAIGFVPFCIGLALVPYALVLFDRFCERPTWARGAIAAAAGTVVYFGHLLPWGLTVACAAMIGLCHEAPRPSPSPDGAMKGEGKRWPRVFVWLGATVPGLVLLLRGASFGLRPGDGVAWKGRSFLESLREFPSYVLDVSAWPEDEVMALVLLAALVGLRLTAPRERLRLHGLRSEACLLVAIVAYFVLPRSVLTPHYWWGVNVRFAAPAVLFATLCVPGPIEGRRRGWLVPVALCGLGFAVFTTVHWKRAARFFGGFEGLVHQPEPGARVLVLAYPPLREPSMQQGFGQSYAALYQAYRGGTMPTNFDLGFPLVYKQRFPAPNWRGGELRWDVHARYYDYVLAFLSPEGLFAGHTHEVKMAAQAGRWSLWKLPGPRLDTPPGPAYPGDWALDSVWTPLQR